MRMLAAVSVDLDSLPHYCRIHGLAEALLDARAKQLVADVAIPRFLDLLAETGAPATFFAIGEDARTLATAAALGRAHRAGVELASHSHAHDYRLSRALPEQIAEDLAQADAALEVITGSAPAGFRAPGYTLSAPLYEATEARGYLYGSSVFPAAPYWAAKAAVMGALALAGRPSHAQLDSPRVLLAPRTPYWPDRAAPYRRGTGEVLELPITVTPRLRLPFIGTLVTSLPWALVRRCYRACLSAPLFNFELHALDLLDASDGIPEALVARQRDLRTAWPQKRARIATVLRWLAEDGALVTLADAARELATRVPRG